MLYICYINLSNSKDQMRKVIAAERMVIVQILHMSVLHDPGNFNVTKLDRQGKLVSTNVYSG